MADAMSDYLENEILDHILGGAGGAWTAPTTVYCALFTTTASLAELEAGTLTNEVANSFAYARTAITFGSAAASGTKSNSADCTFPTASGGSWTTVRYAALMDSSTHGAGNVLFYGQLSQDKTVADGDTFKFNATDWSVTIA
jgi:hypothetical protein